MTSDRAENYGQSQVLLGIELIKISVQLVETFRRYCVLNEIRSVMEQALQRTNFRVSSAELFLLNLPTILLPKNPHFGGL